MEILKSKRLILALGVLMLLASVILMYDYLKSDWKISIEGNHTLTRNEIESYIRFYINQNPDNIVTEDMEEILKFHPRIKEAKVKRILKNIFINLTEKQTGYLVHKGNSINEVSLNGKIIRESIAEKNHLSEKFPIFYLTAENEPEIETIKGDIIQLWEKTSSSHGFLWTRISEIELTRNEMNNPIINLYHSFFPFKFTLYDKMDINSLRKLWAIFNLLESETLRGWKLARIYNDHAVLE